MSEAPRFITRSEAISPTRIVADNWIRRFMPENHQPLDTTKPVNPTTNIGERRPFRETRRMYGRERVVDYAPDLRGSSRGSSGSTSADAVTGEVSLFEKVKTSK